MSIFYFISLIVLFLGMILFKKSDRKLNIIVSIIYSGCILYFFDLIISSVLSFLNIKNILFMFSLIDFFTFGILYLVNKKKYGKLTLQDYYLNKKELISFIVIIVLCILFGIIRYSGFNSTNYRISDATVHYKMSHDYSTYQKLFDKGYSDPFYEFKNSMFGYYVPCGIFMSFLPFNGPTSFNIFNTLFLCLLTLSFYATIIVMKKDDKHDVFRLFLVLLYALAYPLNYTLFGFGYLGPGILSVTLIILTWKLIDKYDNKKLFYLLFLFNFGLFVSYYLFVPAVYLSEGLFLIYLFVNDKLKLSELFKYGIISLIVPTLFGFFYLIYQGIGASEAISSYSIDGYSYKNLIGNFILLAPLVIISVINQAKKKKIDFDLVFLIIEILYIILTFLLIGNGYVSPYYFYKSYYALWIIVYIFIFKLIDVSEHSLLLKVSYSLIVLCIFFSVFDIEKMVSDKNKDFSYSGTVHQLGDIYAFNYEMFSNSLIISKEEIELIFSASKYSKKCNIGKKNNDLPYLSFYSQRRWFYMITGIVPAMDYAVGDSNDVYTRKLDYDAFMNSNKIQCILVSNKYMEENKKDFKIDYDKFDILFKNKKGKLIKKR